MNVKNSRVGGASFDAILLTFIKVVTAALGLIITRLLSEYLSIHDYGNYSQVLLVISAVASVTMLGMMDGINYFYCSENDPDKRETYVTTIFALQCIVGTLAGCIVLLLSSPLCVYFENPDIKRLMIFAAVLPLLQNLLGMLQVLVVSVGRARILAVRNLLVSTLRLVAVVVIVSCVRDTAILLTVTCVLDIVQIALFWWILHRNNCRIQFVKIDFRLTRRILLYCAPMAVFTTINALNRDIDKYLVSLMTDTETLAMYANASKQLPFDIIMSSFCTVLVPDITRLIAGKERQKATKLYRLFLEITYISTGILCCAALAAAPQLMKLLYSNKYTNGLTIFCIYILVDLLRFSNITLILSAAGKTKWLMIMGLCTILLNALLNVVLYQAMGLLGPAVATLIVTVVLGMVMLNFSAKVLETNLSSFFDLKYLMLFVTESLIMTFALGVASRFLDDLGMHYFVILIIIAGAYGLTMLLLNGKRLLNNMKAVNHVV